MKWTKHKQKDDEFVEGKVAKVHVLLIEINAH